MYTERRTLFIRQSDANFVKETRQRFARLLLYPLLLAQNY
jgi:hypothetical protein